MTFHSTNGKHRSSLGGNRRHRRTRVRASVDRWSTVDNLLAHPLSFLAAAAGLLAILVLKSLLTRSADAGAA